MDPVLLVVLCAIMMIVGIVGVAIPVLPGLVLCWAAVLLWALFAGAGTFAWVVFAVATVLFAAGVVVKFLWPGRNLKAAGVPGSTIAVGILLGVVGMFVIPVVGLVIGFVLGVWAMEALRLGSISGSWPSTVQALRAVGLSMLIELAAALLISLAWTASLVLA